MKFYICRHAEKESVDVYSKLSERGHEQARLLGRHLARNTGACPLILSSPYERCLETASAIAREYEGACILVENGLAEGPVNSREAHTPVSLHTLKAAFGMLDPEYVSYYPMPSGENTQRDVLVRCMYMSRHLLHTFARNNKGRDVVVVTHGTVAMGLVAAMATSRQDDVCACVADAVQGASAAGYYTVERTCTPSAGSVVRSDFRCCSAFLPVPPLPSATTPVCTFVL